MHRTHLQKTAIDNISRPLDGLKALVADQHHQARMTIRDQLLHAGISSVTTAVSAHDLIRRLRDESFDIVLCDHHLDHKKDGQKILEELRYLKYLPLTAMFLVVTSERSRPSVVSTLEFAPDDYLIKPFTPSEISKRMLALRQKKMALRHAYTMYESQQMDALLVECDRIIKRGRYINDATRLKAETLLTLKRPKEAMALYVSISEGNVVPWARLGVSQALILMGRCDIAKDSLKQLIDEMPHFMTAYDAMADACEKSGDYHGAIEAITRAGAVTKPTLQRLEKLRQLALTVGDKNLEVKTLRMLIEQSSQTALAKTGHHVSLVTRLCQTGQLLEANIAIAEFDKEHGKNEQGQLAVLAAQAIAITIDTSSLEEKISQVIGGVKQKLGSQADEHLELSTLVSLVELAHTRKDEVLLSQVQTRGEAVFSGTDLSALQMAIAKSSTVGENYVDLSVIFGEVVAQMKDEPSVIGTENVTVDEVEPAAINEVGMTEFAAPEIVPAQEAEVIVVGFEPLVEAANDLPKLAPTRLMDEIFLEWNALSADLHVAAAAERIDELDQCGRRLLSEMAAVDPFDRRVVRAHLHFDKWAAMTGKEKHQLVMYS